MGKGKKQMNRHHIIGQSLRNEYNVNAKENILMMNTARHCALHSLFNVLLTPKEQLRELACIYDGVLSDTARELFEELFTLPDEDFYIDKVLKKNGKKLRG